MGTGPPVQMVREHGHCTSSTKGALPPQGPINEGNIALPRSTLLSMGAAASARIISGSTYQGYNCNAVHSRFFSPRKSCSALQDDPACYSISRPGDTWSVLSKCRRSQMPNTKRQEHHGSSGHQRHDLTQEHGRKHKRDLCSQRCQLLSCARGCGQRVAKERAHTTTEPMVVSTHPTTSFCTGALQSPGRLALVGVICLLADNAMCRGNRKIPHDLCNS